MPDIDHMSVVLLVLCLPFGAGGGVFLEKQLDANRIITNTEKVLDYGKPCGTLIQIPNFVTNLCMLLRIMKIQCTILYDSENTFYVDSTVGSQENSPWRRTSIIRVYAPILNPPW